MTRYMSAMVDVLCFRKIARELAYSAPVFTALMARIMMLFSTVWIVLSICSVVQGRADIGSALLDLLVFVITTVLAWALFGAANEVYCRIMGQPVQPW